MGSGPLIAPLQDKRRPAATILGVPFDSTHTYRPGTRFGPSAIREAFNNIEIFHPDIRVDLEETYIEDLGDMTHTVNAQEMLDMVGKVTSELAKDRNQIVMMGGEHLITYGAYAQFPRGTGYVVFDAHYDLRDSFAGTRLGHATYLRRVAEQCGSDGIIHVGARAFVGEEVAYLKESKIRTVTDHDIRTGDGPRLLRDAISVFDNLYVSLDLDVLDPAYAPGVGNPEAVGITSRELMDMIHAIKDARIVSADIVELNPQYDNGATAAIAAKIMSYIIAANV